MVFVLWNSGFEDRGGGEMNYLSEKLLSAKIIERGLKPISLTYYTTAEARGYPTTINP
jgi:hypothetical protein